MIEKPLFNFQARLQDQTIRKVLIVRPGRVGDVLTITPLMRKFHEAYPHVEIHLWTSDYALPIIQDHPLLKDRILVSKHRPSRWKRWIEDRRMVKQVNALQPDMAILLSQRKSDRKVLQRSMIPHVFIPERSSWDEASAKENVVQGFIEALKPLGMQGRAGDLELYYRDDQIMPVQRAFAQAQVDLGQPFAIIHPGCFQLHRKTILSTSMRRLWPSSYFESLAKKLQEELNLPIVLSGHGESEEQLIEGFLKRLPGPTVDGRLLDLQALSACLDRASLLVTLDTGPLHMGAALKTPTVALFGPSSPRSTGPWGSGVHKVLYRGIECSPCRGKSIPCRENVCLTGISVEEVFEACRDVLAHEVT